MLHVNGSRLILLGRYSTSESRQQTRVLSPIALHQFAPSAHVGGGEPVQCQFTDGRDLSAIERSGARRPGARRTYQHLNTLLQQSALQAQSGTTSLPQPDLHREMLARVKEFDGDDDKWVWLVV